MRAKFLSLIYNRCQCDLTEPQHPYERTGRQLYKATGVKTCTGAFKIHNKEARINNSNIRFTAGTALAD